jgi:hypothetical protein
MRANEVLMNLDESRGISARQPGDVYVNPNNPEDTLTIIDIKFARPENEYAFDTYQELEGALDQMIPQDGNRVNDNSPNSASKAAIIAEVERPGGDREFHVRYMKDLMSIHNKWLTFAGYKYQAAAETESMPIKPSDVVPDEQARTVKELIATIHSNLDSQLEGTGYENVAKLIEKVIDEAAGGNKAIKFENRNQASIIAKYAGEYSGVIALLSDNVQNMSIQEIEDHYEIKDLRNSRVIFPQDTAGMLIDSTLLLDNGTRVGVSSKMHKAGGAASSLLGIYKIMTPETARRFPKGATIIKDLAVLPAFSADPRNAGTLGPVVLARQMKVISESDIQEIERLDRNQQDPSVLESKRLKSILANQGVNPGTAQRQDYSVYLHMLTAIVNLIIPRVNSEPEFAEVINATLRENSYIQILTKIGLNGNQVTFTYYVKLPGNNKPFIYNKNYFATGNKGRVGFKLEK